MRIALFFIALALTTGCQKDPHYDPISGLTVGTDKETGCQYLVKKANKSGGVAPRIAADGITHMGCTAQP